MHFETEEGFSIVVALASLHIRRKHSNNEESSVDEEQLKTTDFVALMGFTGRYSVAAVGNMAEYDSLL